MGCPLSLLVLVFSGSRQCLVCNTSRYELLGPGSGLRMQRPVRWDRHSPILLVSLVQVIHSYVFSVRGIVARFWVCVSGCGP